MKKILLILCLFVSCITYAQNNLPPCNGNFSGPCFGVSDYTNGQYVGQFKDDKRNGQGTFTSTNGHKYVGQWKDGEYDGQGTYTYPSGNKYVGQWKNNNYDGFGTFYYANGSIKQQGLWRDDKFVQAQTPPAVPPPVVPKPPVNNAQDIKRQKCIRLGLVPGSADFQQCIN